MLYLANGEAIGTTGVPSQTDACAISVQTQFDPTIVGAPSVILGANATTAGWEIRRNASGWRIGFATSKGQTTFSLTDASLIAAGIPNPLDIRRFDMMFYPGSSVGNFYGFMNGVLVKSSLETDEPQPTFGNAFVGWGTTLNITAANLSTGGFSVRRLRAWGGASSSSIPTPANFTEHPQFGGRSGWADSKRMDSWQGTTILDVRFDGSGDFESEASLVGSITFDQLTGTPVYLNDGAATRTPTSMIGGGARVGGIPVIVSPFIQDAVENEEL